MYAAYLYFRRIESGCASGVSAGRAPVGTGTGRAWTGHRLWGGEHRVDGHNSRRSAGKRRRGHRRPPERFICARGRARQPERAARSWEYARAKSAHGGPRRWLYRAPWWLWHLRCTLRDHHVGADWYSPTTHRTPQYRGLLHTTAGAGHSCYDRGLYQPDAQPAPAPQRHTGRAAGRLRRVPAARESGEMDGAAAREIER